MAPLQQAFRQYADPVILARLDELEPYANEYADGVAEHLFNEHNALQQQLEDALLERLRRGELVARAIVLGGPVNQGYVPIPPERWARLEINHETYEACGPNRLVLAEVEIREAEPVEAEEQGGLATTAKEADRGFEHDPDYRWVRLRGEEFKLGSKQSRVVRQLHAASRTDDPWVHGKELLRHKPAIESSSIRDLFKSKPNWKVLIESDGRSHYRLNLPRPRADKP
jgi:hypothetical protein